MSQHHDRREKKGCGVGESLSSDIRGTSVNGFKDGSILSDVSRRGESESSDESSAHVRENISV